MPIKPILLLFSLFAACLMLPAQTVRRPLGSYYSGFGAYSTKQSDVFSFTNNQASLSQIKNAGAGILGEKRFLLSELNLYQAAIAIPAKPGAFGVKLGYFGFSEYNESQIGLAYGRSLGDKVDIGLQLNYNNIRINTYGSAAALGFEAGTVLHLTEQLNAGLHIANIAGSKFGKNNQEELASVYSFGLGYDASDKFFISTEIEKEENQSVNINIGAQYRPIQQLLIRGGIATSTSNAYIGAGFISNSFRLDVTASFHPQLGITPGMMLIYDFKNKE